MSSMLDQAIVDAQALKEAAIKSAESSIIEKYSQEIREAVDGMLSQEEIISEEEDVVGAVERAVHGGACAAPRLSPLSLPLSLTGVQHSLTGGGRIGVAARSATLTTLVFTGTGGGV